ncbi:MAG: cytochrome ubiquinol oxidase subunit I, partial [Verrucomicrobiota bacterium]
VMMTFAGWGATIAGWYVTEMGRQPWLVQGILRAKDAVAEVPPANVALTLAGYLLTYAFLLVAYVRALFYLARREGPGEGEEGFLEAVRDFLPAWIPTPEGNGSGG